MLPKACQILHLPPLSYLAKQECLARSNTPLATPAYWWQRRPNAQVALDADGMVLGCVDVCLSEATCGIRPARETDPFFVFALGARLALLRHALSLSNPICKSTDSHLTLASTYMLTTGAAEGSIFQLHFRVHLLGIRQLRYPGIIPVAHSHGHPYPSGARGICRSAMGWCLHVTCRTWHPVNCSHTDSCGLQLCPLGSLTRGMSRTWWCGRTFGARGWASS